MQEKNKKTALMTLRERFLLLHQRWLALVLRVILLAADLPSRANPSYKYQNFVLVVNTRGSSALPKN